MTDVAARAPAVAMPTVPQLAQPVLTAGPRQRRWWPLVLALVVVLAAVGAACYFFVVRGGNTEQKAATGLAGILSADAHTLPVVETAYQDANSCGPRLRSDPATFSHAAATQQRLMGELSALAGRTTLTPTLLRRVTHLLRANKALDYDLSQFASAQRGTCIATTTTTKGMNFVTTAGGLAIQTAQLATVSWDPLARKFGLTTYLPTQL